MKTVKFFFECCKDLTIRDIAEVAVAFACIGILLIGFAVACL